MSNKGERIDIRLSHKNKELIERAAALKGISVTDFVRDCAGDEARKTIREHQEMELSRRDSEAFAEALINPPSAGPRLKEAARRYRETLNE